MQCVVSPLQRESTANNEDSASGRSSSRTIAASLRRQFSKLKPSVHVHRGLFQKNARTFRSLCQYAITRPEILKSNLRNPAELKRLQYGCKNYGRFKTDHWPFRAVDVLCRDLCIVSAHLGAGRPCRRSKTENRFQDYRRRDHIGSAVWTIAGYCRLAGAVGSGGSVTIFRNRLSVRHVDFRTGLGRGGQSFSG